LEYIPSSLAQEKKLYRQCFAGHFAWLISKLSYQVMLAKPYQGSYYLYSSIQVILNTWGFRGLDIQAPLLWVCILNKCELPFKLIKPLIMQKTDITMYSVHHRKHSGPENECGTLVIFHTSTETIGGLILVVIPHTCTDSHILTVVIFSLLLIKDPEIPKLKKKTYFLWNLHNCA
jgi:hypothetical protein